MSDLMLYFVVRFDYMNIKNIPETTIAFIRVPLSRIAFGCVGVFFYAK